MKQNNNFRIYLPILFAIIFTAGIFLGKHLQHPDNNTVSSSELTTESNKISNILSFINDNYVDTVSYKKLVDLSIDAVLQNLDPHSYYIPKEELGNVNVALEGSFEGVGIEFNIRKDTIFVVSAIAGGPSEKAGIQAGDRIVKIDDKTVAGVKITNKDVFTTLRGEKGTKVKVSILRPGHPELIDFDITRGKIPNKSIDAAFMVDQNTGYIKLSKFSLTSYDEFYLAGKKLIKQGMKKLIFDLRGNGGGYLNAAINISNEFLPKGAMIVYTEGRMRNRKEYHATRAGILKETEVLVLIDEFSASASEIVSGAIQDNDRGIVAGRRSFGKGLVQEQVELPDRSAIRLTVARYHTPTGRCIQKPYNDNISEYYNDLVERYHNGELKNKDSIHFNDSLKYTTPGGKTVYGGGGIMPDVFIGVDTVGVSAYLRQLNSKNIISLFSFEYADQHRKSIKAAFQNGDRFARDFTFDDQMITAFVAFAKEKGVAENPEGLKKSKEIIQTQLKALIGRNVFGSEVFYQVILSIDNVFLEAEDILNEHK